MAPAGSFAGGTYRVLDDAAFYFALKRTRYD